MTMALVAQLIVPRLATWCALFTVRDTDLAELAYAWHADETMVSDLRTLLELLPPAPPPEDPGPWDGFAPAPEGDLPATAHRVTGDIAHVFPMLARGRSIGMLVVGGPKGARFARDMLELTEDLAGRAALAIDNARLYEEQADTSRTLQRSLLPPEIPEIPGLDLAVVYEPAGREQRGRRRLLRRLQRRLAVEVRDRRRVRHRARGGGRDRPGPSHAAHPRRRGLRHHGRARAPQPADPGRGGTRALPDPAARRGRAAPGRPRACDVRHGGPSAAAVPRPRTARSPAPTSPICCSGCSRRRTSAYGR